MEKTCNLERYFNNDPDIVRWDNCMAQTKNQNNLVKATIQSIKIPLRIH